MLLLWATAFVWTCALELPLYAFFLRRAELGWTQLTLLVLAINLATHPAFNFLLPKVVHFRGWEILGELLVALAEGLMVGGFLVWRRAPSPWRMALLASFAANAVSALASFPFAWLFSGS